MAVRSAPAGLDIAASRTGGKVWLHVANVEYRRAVEASVSVDGMRVTGGRVFEIAPEDLRTDVNRDQPEVFKPRESALPAGGQWRFPGGIGFGGGTGCDVKGPWRCSAAPSVSCPEASHQRFCEQFSDFV